MNSTQHLPPAALDDWVSEVAAELGIVVDASMTTVILDLARDVAHDVARPAAPVTAYLLGLAVGMNCGDGGGDVQEAVADRDALAQSLVDLAARHRP